jgi:hypothetical protein
MAMAEAYQGVLQADGRLMVNGSPVKSKAPRRVVFNFLDDTEATTADDAEHNRQVTTVKKFLADISELKDEDDTMTDADWDELANIRARTNVGLSRRVEI